MSDPAAMLDSVDTFYVYKKQRVIELYNAWRHLLPEVAPYYAIKCNPDSLILDTLADMGACFDVASPAEVDAALHRVCASKIIYANPCKTVADICYASDKGVRLTVFDNPYEFDKIREAAPNMKMLLRIYASDSSAQCVLSNKFGAMPDELEDLLIHIKSRGQHAVNSVVGVSFHIGSGANDPYAFNSAIKTAASLFKKAESLSFTFSILDIGGGFTHTNITAMATCITESTKWFNTMYPQTKVIAEPGRYFAESVAKLYTKVIGVRVRGDARHYWINDSLYGSFNCILYDHAKPTPHALTLHNEPKVSSTIWGATCDGFDKIAEGIQLPMLSIGDWMEWEHMGAYTQAGASRFNGIPFADTPKYYI